MYVALRNRIVTVRNQQFHTYYLVHKCYSSFTKDNVTAFRNQQFNIKIIKVHFVIVQWLHQVFTINGLTNLSIAWQYTVILIKWRGPCIWNYINNIKQKVNLIKTYTYLWYSQMTNVPVTRHMWYNWSSWVIFTILFFFPLIRLLFFPF